MAVIEQKAGFSLGITHIWGYYMDSLNEDFIKAVAEQIRQHADRAATRAVVNLEYVTTADERKALMAIFRASANGLEPPTIRQLAKMGRISQQTLFEYLEGSDWINVNVGFATPTGFATFERIGDYTCEWLSNETPVETEQEQKRVRHLIYMALITALLQSLRPDEVTSIVSRFCRICGREHITDNPVRGLCPDCERNTNER